MLDPRIVDFKDVNLILLGVENAVLINMQLMLILIRSGIKDYLLDLPGFMLWFHQYYRASGFMVFFNEIAYIRSLNYHYPINSVCHKKLQSMRI